VLLGLLTVRSLGRSWGSRGGLWLVGAGVGVFCVFTSVGGVDKWGVFWYN